MARGDLAFFELVSFLFGYKCWALRKSFIPKTGRDLVNLGLFCGKPSCKKITHPCNFRRAAWQTSEFLFFISERCKLDLYGKFLFHMFTFSFIYKSF